jgi:hypothetical protein
MLGGAAMGVAHATEEERPVASAHAAATTVRDNELPPWPVPSAPDESPPADEDDEEEETAPTPPPSTTTGTPRPRPRAPRTPGPLDSASYRVAPGRVTGYRAGRSMSITVTMVDGKPVEVRTAAAFERMRAAAARAGVNLRVVSGFRTMEHQRALYSAFRSGRGNLAALPGHSNHQSGHALDLNVRAPGVLRWLEAHAREYGFRRTVPSENWHWERW